MPLTPSSGTASPGNSCCTAVESHWSGCWLGPHGRRCPFELMVCSENREKTFPSPTGYTLLFKNKPMYKSVNYITVRDLQISLTWLEGSLRGRWQAGLPLWPCHCHKAGDLGSDQGTVLDLPVPRGEQVRSCAPPLPVDAGSLPGSREVALPQW